MSPGPEVSVCREQMSAGVLRSGTDVPFMRPKTKRLQREAIGVSGVVANVLGQFVPLNESTMRARPEFWAEQDCEVTKWGKSCMVYW